MNYDITPIKRKMLVKYPFFGSVIAGVDYKEKKSVDISETDGETIYYNPDSLFGFTNEEQTFIFAHEVCHIAFDHILRSKGKDPKLWNIATDAVINQFLKRDGLQPIEHAIDIAEAINYDAEQLYEKLLKQQQQQQQQSGNQQQNGQGKGQQKGDQQQSGTSQNPDRQESLDQDENEDQSAQAPLP